MTTRGGRGPRSDTAPRERATSRVRPPAPPRTSEVLDALELGVVNAALQQREARAAQLQQRQADVAAHRARRAEQAAQRERELRDVEDLARLKGRQPGPNLPAHLRRNPRLYVQEEDLEDVLPDDWGLEWRDDAERLGERIGLPAIAVQLLTLLEWFHGLRARAGNSLHGTGGGLQASPEWLARKLGCSERWVQHCINVLDPWAAWRREAAKTKLHNASRAKRGLEPLPMPRRPAGAPCYVQRFSQLKRYSVLTRDLPAKQRVPRWVCRNGRLHEWVDLTGVLYATQTGCRALRRRAAARHRPRPGRTPKLRKSPMAVDLYRRLAPLYRRLRARLAQAPQSDFTPNNVTPSIRMYVGGTRGPSGPEATGPPAGNGPSRGRKGCLPLSGALIGEAQGSRTPPLPESSSALPVGCPGGEPRASLAEVMRERRAELEAMGYRRV